MAVTRSAKPVSSDQDVGGFTAGAAAAGVRDGTARRLDVALIVSDRPCAAAGVFTTNQVIAAPCVVTRRHIDEGPIRAIVVNSGNANACTGELGERDAVAMAQATALKIGCDPHEVAVASTGVIGTRCGVKVSFGGLPRRSAASCAISGVWRCFGSPYGRTLSSIVP